MQIIFPKGVIKLKMSKSTVKSLGIGMAIGGTALAVGSAMMSKPAQKATKKNIAKAVKAAGDMLDNVQHWLK